MNLTSEGHEPNYIRLVIQRIIKIDPKFVLISQVDAEIYTWSPSWIYANEVVPGELFLGHPSANFDRLFQKGTIIAFLCT